MFKVTLASTLTSPKSLGSKSGSVWDVILPSFSSAWGGVGLSSFEHALNVEMAATVKIEIKIFLH